MSKRNLMDNINKMRKVINILESTSLMSMPTQLELTDEQIERIKTLTDKDIDFEQVNEDSPIELKVIFPWGDELSDGIKLHIQVTPNRLFQTHINITPAMQHLGLGYKIYVALIKTYGHIYSGVGRRHNTLEIKSILDKLNNEPDIECYENELGVLCVYSKNPDKEQLLKQFT